MIRMFIDFSKLNLLTVKDAYAIHRIEDILNLVAGINFRLNSTLSQDTGK